MLVAADLGVEVFCNSKSQFCSNVNSSSLRRLILSILEYPSYIKAAVSSYIAIADEFVARESSTFVPIKNSLSIHYFSKTYNILQEKKFLFITDKLNFFWEKKVLFETYQFLTEKKLIFLTLILLLKKSKCLISNLTQPL